MWTKQQVRHKQILDLLGDGKEYHIEELAQLTRVSLPTLRRDLEFLDQAGLLVRTHGGARPKPSSNFKPSYADRMNRLRREKLAIANVALATIQNHDTIALCNGTTTRYLAEAICQSGLEVTVITNAIDSALEMAAFPKVRSILMGGEVTEGYTLNGFWNETMFKRGPRVDKIFLGADGIHLTHGLTAYSQNDAQMHGQMAGLSDQVIALVDSSKFGVAKLAAIIPVSKASMVITDGGLDPEVAATYRDAGVNLRIAPLPAAQSHTG